MQTADVTYTKTRNIKRRVTFLKIYYRYTAMGIWNGLERYIRRRVSLLCKLYRRYQNAFLWFSSGFSCYSYESKRPKGKSQCCKYIYLAQIMSFMRLYASLLKSAINNLMGNELFELSLTFSVTCRLYKETFFLLHSVMYSISAV